MNLFAGGDGAHHTRPARGLAAPSGEPLPSPRPPTARPSPFPPAPTPRVGGGGARGDGGARADDRARLIRTAARAGARGLGRLFVLLSRGVICRGKVLHGGRFICVDVYVGWHNVLGIGSASGAPVLAHGGALVMVTVRFEALRGDNWVVRADAPIDAELCESTVESVRRELQRHCNEAAHPAFAVAHRALVNGVVVGECQPGGAVVHIG